MQIRHLPERGIVSLCRKSILTAGLPGTEAGSSCCRTTINSNYSGVVKWWLKATLRFVRSWVRCWYRLYTLLMLIKAKCRNDPVAFGEKGATFTCWIITHQRVWRENSKNLYPVHWPELPIIGCWRNCASTVFEIWFNNHLEDIWLDKLKDTIGRCWFTIEELQVNGQSSIVKSPYLYILPVSRFRVFTPVIPSFIILVVLAYPGQNHTLHHQHWL